MRLKKYFLKKDPDEKILIQVRVEIDLIEKLKPYMKKNNLKWTDMIRGALQALADEVS